MSADRYIRMPPRASAPPPSSEMPVVVGRDELPTDAQLADVHEQLDESCWRNSARAWLVLAALGVHEVPND